MSNDVIVLGADARARAGLPVVPGAYPPEVGPLYVSGRAYYRALDQTVYNTRGITAFALPARMREGENITPQIAWLKSINVNRIRIFPDWTTYSAGRRNPDGSWRVPPVFWNGHNQNFDDPNFLPWLADAFLPLMKLNGIRCEVVPISEWQRPVADMRRILSSCYEICGTDRFHLVEDVNEPYVPGIDVSKLTAGLFRHNVICAYGTPPIGSNEGYIKPPCVDYVTWRSDRSQMRYFRSSKDSEEMWHFGVPIEDDEPCGAAEYMGADPSGGAMRNNSVQDHVGHHAIARLYGGGTLHIQCMYEGRVPGDDEPRQAEIADAIGEVYAALPDDCYLGQYSRNGLETFPFKLEYPADTPDDPHCTGYASIHGDVAYVVVPKPKPDYVPRLDNGWTSYEKIGPAQGFVYVARR